MFDKIAAVMPFASNMERLTKFYPDVRGLPVKTESHDWTEIFNEAAALALRPAKKGKGSRDTGAPVGFLVGCLGAKIGRLETKNKFSKKSTNERLGKHAIIKGPGGLASLAEINTNARERSDLIGFSGTD